LALALELPFDTAGASGIVLTAAVSDTAFPRVALNFLLEKENGGPGAESRLFRDNKLCFRHMKYLVF
jgi:hypothetical protein